MKDGPYQLDRVCSFVFVRKCLHNSVVKLFVGLAFALLLIFQVVMSFPKSNILPVSVNIPQIL